MARKNGFRIFDKSITGTKIKNEYVGKIFPKPSCLLSDWKLWLSEGCPKNSHLKIAFTWSYSEQGNKYWNDLDLELRETTELDWEIYNSWRVQAGLEPVVKET